jgi:hypothetical protein
MGEPIDLDDPHQFVDARYREVEQRVHVLAIEPAAVLEDFAERPPVILQPPREGARRVELEGVERPQDPRRRPGELDPERVAERMRRIGRDDQDTVARTSPGDGIRRGAGRLTDSALASEKDE